MGSNRGSRPEHSDGQQHGQNDGHGRERANANMTEKLARQLTQTAVVVVGRVVWQLMGIAGASGSTVDGVDLERTATTEEESRTRWPAWQRGPRGDGWGIAGSTRSYHRRGVRRNEVHGGLVMVTQVHQRQATNNREHLSHHALTTVAKTEKGRHAVREEVET
jgi:hypothetical protein